MEILTLASAKICDFRPLLPGLSASYKIQTTAEAASSSVCRVIADFKNSSSAKFRQPGRLFASSRNF